MDLDLPISASSVQLLTGLGSEFGLPPEECLRGTGVPIDALRDPLAEVTARQEFAVMRNLLRHCGDEPGLGVEAGTRYHVAMHGVWGMALITSHTLRETIDIGTRYIDLAWAFTTVSLGEDDGTAVLSVDGGEIPADVRPFLIERISAAIKVIFHDLLSTEVPFSAVHFRHQAPGDTHRYVDAFGVEPAFESADNSVQFDARYLARRLPQANEFVRRGYEQVCRELLAKRRARTGTAGAVRDALVRRPGRIPDVVEVAAGLRLSSRTLFRRLEKEGTTFRALVDEVRETLAEELLVTARMSTEQIARRLGYAEPASFVRAFKRWKGRTPQAYRTETQRTLAVR